MKYIKLFLASSIVEFEQERRELAAYVNSLNNIYVKRGIFFELVVCEDQSNAMAKDRKQNEYNTLIQESQYFYVLFGSAAGDYTIEEFDVALKAFQETQHPKIYTYFLQLPEDQPAAQSVKDFMGRVDRELGHFYSTFTHIDSVKLNLLMELCRDPLVGGQVKLEDGQAILDGRPVLSMENIPLYSKNEAVQKLLAEKKRLDEEFAALVELGDSEPIMRMRLEKDTERSKVAEQLHTLEMDVLSLYRETSEKRQLGKQLNWREKKALELIDAGKYEAAKEILRDKLWKEEVAQAEEVIDTAKTAIQEYISGQRTLIQTLKSEGIDANTEQEILAIYEEITDLAKKHLVELDTLFDYASFLYDQNRFQEGICIAKQLKGLYEVFPAKDEDQAELLNLLGMLYSHNNDFAASEVYFREALEIHRRLAQENPSAYELDVATNCNNLANLLNNLHQYDEAEALHRETLEILLRLAQENPSAHEHYLAMSCNNLAFLLKDLQQYDEAEKLYRKALEIHRRLAQENPSAYELDVATNCNNLANLLKDLHQYDEAEKLYREALKICRRFAQDNPSAFEPFAADSCYNLALFAYNEKHNKEEARALFSEALRIYEKYPHLASKAETVSDYLKRENPSAYEPEEAVFYNNLANLLSDLQQYDEAEKLYREALEIYQKLAQGDPSAYEPDVASTCCNLASLVDNDEDAFALLSEALRIYEKYPHLAAEAETVRDYLKEHF